MAGTELRVYLNGSSHFFSRNQFVESAVTSSPFPKASNFYLTIVLLFNSPFTKIK